jgi:hypothetical protein
MGHPTFWKRGIMPVQCKTIIFNFICTPIDDWDELPFPKDTKKCFLKGYPTSVKEGIREFVLRMVDEFCMKELPEGCVITAVPTIDTGDGSGSTDMVFDSPLPENDGTN